MATLIQSIYAIMTLFGVTLLFVVTKKLLGGEINTVGLIRETRDGPVLPERLLMLLTTIGTAFAIVSYSLAQGRLPDVPAEAVTGLGGGNLLYLVGKLFKSRGNHVKIV